MNDEIYLIFSVVLSSGEMPFNIFRYSMTPQISLNWRILLGRARNKIQLKKKSTHCHLLITEETRQFETKKGKHCPVHHFETRERWNVLFIFRTDFSPYYFKPSCLLNLNQVFFCHVFFLKCIIYFILFLFIKYEGI